jgi:hypothetical protein
MQMFLDLRSNQARLGLQLQRRMHSSPMNIDQFLPVMIGFDFPIKKLMILTMHSQPRPKSAFGL